MADDNGLIADIETDIKTKLAAVTLSSETVFKTAEHFGWQIQGPDSWDRLSPFAYVHYTGTSGIEFEGDYALSADMEFAILVGTEIPGLPERARIGEGDSASVNLRNLGISRLRELVITALHNKRPSTTAGDTEHYIYGGDRVVVSEPNRCAIEMIFRVQRVYDY